MLKKTRVPALMLLLLAVLCVSRNIRAGGDADVDVDVATNETSAVSDVQDPASNAFDQIELLTEVLVKIKADYVEDKSYKTIIAGALDGMLTSLDPYSGFLDERSFKTMQEDTSGEFAGIGIHVGKKSGLLTVIAPIEGTPAYRAGLQTGDIIDEIDGEKTLGKTLKDTVDKLRGPKGEVVKLKIYRVGEEDPFEIELTRDNIVVPNIKGARIIRAGIGYLRIVQFSRPTSGLLEEKLAELTKDGMKALIIDLRSNPGGLLDSSIDVSSLFLKKGELVVSTKGRKLIYDKEAKSRGKVHYADMPMAILVNEGSASASEIVAGSLKDNKRAIIVGEKTYGKGSVQSIRPLDSNTNTAVRMTTAYYHTPSGVQIHGKGIEPDIEVHVSPSEWRSIRIRRDHIENPDVYTDEEKSKYLDVVDRPLQRALDLMEGILIFQR